MSAWQSQCKVNTRQEEELKRSVSRTLDRDCRQRVRECLDIVDVI